MAALSLPSPHCKTYSILSIYEHDVYKVAGSSPACGGHLHGPGAIGVDGQVPELRLSGRILGPASHTGADPGAIGY